MFANIAYALNPVFTFFCSFIKMSQLSKLWVFMLKSMTPGQACHNICKRTGKKATAKLLRHHNYSDRKPRGNSIYWDNSKIPVLISSAKCTVSLYSYFLQSAIFMVMTSLWYNKSVYIDFRLPACLHTTLCWSSDKLWVLWLHCSYWFSFLCGGSQGLLW